MNFDSLDLSLIIWGSGVISFSILSPVSKEVIDIPNEVFVFLVGKKSLYQEKIERIT